MSRHSHRIMAMPTDDLLKLFNTTVLLIQIYEKRYYYSVYTENLYEIRKIETDLLFYKEVIDIVNYEITIREQESED